MMHLEERDKLLILGIVKKKRLKSFVENHLLFFIQPRSFRNLNLNLISGSSVTAQIISLGFKVIQIFTNVIFFRFYDLLYAEIIFIVVFKNIYKSYLRVEITLISHKKN